MATDTHHEFKLGEWHVKPLRGVVQNAEESRRLTPKSMDVLLCLARHGGEVVSRDVFLQEVWDRRAFGDDPLNKCIAELRRVLGDRSGEPRFIETIPKRGYRLIAPVNPIGDSSQVAAAPGGSNLLRMAALAVLVALAAFGAWQLSQKVVPTGEIQIAVLPFESLSDDAKQYFADGVHEELIAELSKSQNLAVRSRTSTLQFRGRFNGLQDIADKLGVDVIVEGSVRQDGDTVRISAHVIDVDADENLWAGSFERSVSVAGIFAIQNEIAEEIARALAVTLHESPQETQASLPTDNIVAYDAFMLGKFHYRRKLPGDIRESVRQFEYVVTLDPNFADAWDWLAYAYNHAATGVGYLSPAEAYPKARAAALRALELQPDLATALSILGYIRAVHDRDWIGAVADLERAVEIDPADSGTVWSLAHVYSMLGRHDEAIQLTKDFAARPPQRGRNYLEVANRMLDAGDYESALKQLDRAEQHNAEPGDVADTRGFALVGLGRLADAEPLLVFAVEARQRAAGPVARLAHVKASLGHQEAAVALLDELRARAEDERISPLAIATALAGFGDSEATLREIRAAVDIGGREVFALATDPFFRSLRENAEFQEIIESLNLPSS